MILGAILLHKKKEVIALKKKFRGTSLRRAALAVSRKPRAFEKALRGGKDVAVIAEIKRKSPSRGLLCRNFDPLKIAQAYEASGAKALSVLTDKKFFGGSNAILKRVRKTTGLPILRKEFIIDEAQLYESRLIGADAVLLIARILSRSTIKRFTETARELGLAVLYEIHDRRDWQKIKKLKPALVGINNRDLNNFRVSLSMTKKLSKLIPRSVLLVSESGIRTCEDLKTVRKWGAKAVLVGEGLVTQKDPGRALKALLIGTSHDSR